MDQEIQILESQNRYSDNVIIMLSKLDDKRRDLNREAETQEQMKILEQKKSRLKYSVDWFTFKLDKIENRISELRLG